MLIADPSHPGKAIANPVVWFHTPVVTEVKKNVLYHFLILFFC
jgi:hypothetical protein